jgi:hypothetical protein
MTRDRDAAIHIPLAEIAAHTPVLSGTLGIRRDRNNRLPFLGLRVNCPFYCRGGRAHAYRFEPPTLDLARSIGPGGDGHFGACPFRTRSCYIAIDPARRAGNLRTAKRYLEELTVYTNALEKARHAWRQGGDPD